MAYGYERGFVLEHDETLRRRINCKDCINYNRDDKSCMKRPLYLPEDGYDSWKGCKFFDLESRASHYDLKAAEYERVIRQARKNEKEKQKQSAKKQNLQLVSTRRGSTASVASKDASQKQVPATNAAKKSAAPTILPGRRAGYTVFRYYDGKLPKGLTYEYFPYTDTNGSQKKMMIGLDTKEKFAYVNNSVYTSACIDQVVRRYFL